MTTAFPSALDSYSVKVDGVDDVLASHVNNLQDAIVAIETLMGINAENLSPPNVFINGGFENIQRAPGGDTGVTTTRKFVADRWAVKTGAGTLSNVLRTTSVRTGARSTYALELVGATGVTTVNIDQRIESILAGLYKRTLYFSGYVYNNTGASFTPKIYVSTPAAADNWTTPTVINGSGLGENLQSCSNGNWTRVTWNGDVSAYSNIGNGLEFRIEIPSGSMISGDTVRLAELNLSSGFSAAFNSRPAGLELMLCQRYYEKSYPQATAPGTANITAGASFGVATTTGIISPIGAIYKVPKRTAPTITLWSYDGLANKVSVTLSAGSVGGTVTAAGGENMMTQIGDSGTAFTAGVFYWFGWAANAEL